MISRSLLFLSVIVFFNGNVFAANKLDKVPEATIPIIVEKFVPALNSANSIKPPSSWEAQAFLPSGTISKELFQIPISNLKNIIKQFKEELCFVNKKGSFEISLQFDVDAKVIGVGISGKSGIIAKISCD